MRHATPFVLLAFVLVGCGSSGGAATPRSTGTVSLAPGGTSTAAPSPSGTEAGDQTDTEWGPIWDTLPKDFPSYPGSTPAEETATGPASANLVVTGGDARAIATALQTSLKGAGYTTVGLSGPLEDGSYVLDMTGSTAGCKVQVKATPTGGLTTLTIMYGAACPHG